MSGEQPSGSVHYTLSVTNRQAAAFFLTLLVALGLSFFFGMKTGAAAKRGPDAAARLAAVSDLPVSDAGPERKAGGEREVIGFDAPTPVPASTPAPTPSPEATALPEPAKTALPAKGEEAPKLIEGPAERPAEKAVQKPAEKVTEKPAEKPAEKKEGPFFVQVFATKDAAKADAFLAKLTKDGFKKADISQAPDKPDLFRIRLGPYPDRAKAEAMARKAQKSERLKDPPIVTAKP